MAAVRSGGKEAVAGTFRAVKPVTSPPGISVLQVTVLATLTCAGSRRKEENMVKKTIGFSWGPAGTACSYWTGVRMSHLLQLAGVDEDREVSMRMCVCGEGVGGSL